MGVQGRRAGMDQRCDAGTRPRDEAAVPLVRPCAHHQGARQGTSGRAAEAGKIAHRGPRRPPGGIQGWMAAEQRECIAV